MAKLNAVCRPSLNEFVMRPGKKRSPGQVQVLGRILAAARDVFAEQGYDASMEAIATRADVGVGTLYRRFPTKADLFKAVVDAARRRVREIAEEVLADVAPR